MSLDQTGTAGWLPADERKGASQDTGPEYEQMLVTFPPGAPATGRPDVGELSARKQ